MTARSRMWAVAVAVLAVLAAGCSEPVSDEGAGSGEGSATTAATAGCSGETLLACARDSIIADLVPNEPTTADGEPITLGMVNQENTPAGSFPELSQATLAAVDFVNEQLGGVDGRPIEVEVCNTEFTAEGSTACGQRFVEAGVPAVLGGIDVFGNAVEVLEDNGVPYIGGIPVSTQSMRSPVSFQWSGGTWGATVAFAEYAAAELDAESVAIVYGDFGSVAEGAEYGRAVLEDNDVETQLVPFPVVSTDLNPPLSAAASVDPDAIFVLAADTSCKPALEATEALGIEAQTFYVGACAAPTIIDDVDTAASNGAIFNVEGPVDAAQTGGDTELYTRALAEYSDGLDPQGAGTVTFRSFMNLYVQLVELGGDGITSESIIDTLDAQEGTPSFMGHPYTCDGQQFAGLPAVCSPQQILAEMEGRTLASVSDWIDVGEAYPG